MGLKYIYVVAEAMDDIWEVKVICMQRCIVDKKYMELEKQSDGFRDLYLFRVPQDTPFKFPLVAAITENALMKDACLTLEVA